MTFPGGELVPSGGGDKIPLVRPQLIIGRSDTADICLKVSNVSSKHGELLCEEGIWYIRDLDSTNGIRVNGIRIPTGVKKLVRPGDRIGIGQRQFTLEYVAAADLPEEEFRDLNPETVFKQSLLERAGLAHPDPEPERPRRSNPPPPQEEAAPPALAEPPEKADPSPEPPPPPAAN